MPDTQGWRARSWWGVERGCRQQRGKSVREGTGSSWNFQESFDQEAQWGQHTWKEDEDQGTLFTQRACFLQCMQCSCCNCKAFCGLEHGPRRGGWAERMDGSKGWCGDQEKAEDEKACKCHGPQEACCENKRARTENCSQTSFQVELQAQKDKFSLLEGQDRCYEAREVCGRIQGDWQSSFSEDVSWHRQWFGEGRVKNLWSRKEQKKSGENGFGFWRHVSLKQNQHQHVFVGVIFAYLELLRFFCKLGLLLQVGVTFASWGYFCKHMLFEHFMHLQLFVCSLRGQEQKATHVVTVRNEQVNKRYKHAHTQNMFRNRTVFYTESSHSFHSKQQETRSKQETREEPRHLLILGFTSSCSAVILEVLGILLLVAPPTLLVLLPLLLLLLLLLLLRLRLPLPL